ncbi:MAG TPA: PEP/pyruvate-binding domain-containing protein [Solirubrobacteraceae bacterium]
MPYTLALEELTAAHGSRFGGKSASLGELLCAGIPVPPGFALCTDAYLAAIAAAGLDEPTAETIRAVEIPPAVRDEIAKRYAALADSSAEPDPPVAVRSSAVGEDSAEATFAGQQETYLWVRGVDAVCDAVRDCWASLYSTTAISYRNRLCDAGAPAMGVTVQRMVDARVSGVLFTCNPTSGDPSMVAVNASWGLGLAVVGGEVTPDDLLVSKVTGEIVREHINDKHIEYVPDPDGDGALAVEVGDDRRTARCLDHTQLPTLVDVAKRIQKHFGSHQDVEWAFARQDGELYVLQSRPVTTLPGKPAKPQPASAISLVMNTFGVKGED